MQLSIERICVPTDFSAAADHAVHYAAALANTYGSSLHILHVIEHAGPLVHHPDFTSGGEVARSYFNKLEKAVTKAEARLNETEGERQRDVSELLKSLESEVAEKIAVVDNPWWSGLEVHRDIRYGHAAREINDYVKGQSIDLVVMGTHGHSRLAAMLLGSVTERVLRPCSVPVTIVRHPDHRYKVIDAPQ